MGTKGDETKKRIIRASRRLFRRQGFSATSMDDICRESGVKRGNLYFHFKGKEELALAVINDYAEKIIPFFRILIDDEPDPVRRIELMIDGIMGYYEARTNMAG
ncbi:TetR/AcrR family transcriptional regulator [Thermodesulfobacteriota bacterium]